MRGPVQTDVLFIVGCNEGESKRYRTHNFAEALSHIGVHGDVRLLSDIPTLLQYGFSAKALVLFRAGMEDRVEHLIHEAKARRIPVFFDIDDLVFEPQSWRFHRVVTTFDRTAREDYLAGVRRLRATLLACDHVICATQFLCDRAQRIHPSVSVLPNALNAEQMQLADRLGSAPVASGEIRIGYFSGTATHAVDFEVAEQALLETLAEYPSVRFVPVGHLDLGHHWAPFKSRIERHPYAPHLRMLELLSRVHINIAPLEIPNPFCEGKSAQKVFEAGLVSVPTIASPIQSYEASIDSWVDGVIARDASEWRKALAELVTNHQLRAELGRRARTRALARSAPKAQSRQAKGVFLSPMRVHQPSTENGLRTAWLVPNVPKGSGGHRNIFRMVSHLLMLGHECEIYLTDSLEPIPNVRRVLRDYYEPLDCPIQQYAGRIEHCDVLWATQWTTVQVALTHRDAARKLAYFIQDFEPAFHPMGSNYVMAENTYLEELERITLGPWCAKVLETELGVKAAHYDYPIDRSVYRPELERRLENRILFFARPDIPRRACELGVEALLALRAKAPHLDIGLFGSDSLVVPQGFRNFSLLKTPQELAALYATAALGIAFSTLNPTFVAYEMMACGVPVVDIARPHSHLHYGGNRDLPLLTEADPEIMAADVLRLLEDPGALHRRRQAGLAFAARLPTERGVAQQLADWMNTILCEGSAAGRAADVAGE